VGGYDDWLRQRPAPANRETPDRAEKPEREKRVPEKRKLSYRETRELEALPRKIEDLEQQKAEIYTILSSPQFYARGRGDSGAVTGTSARLEALERELEQAYQRWEELEDFVS